MSQLIIRGTVAVDGGEFHLAGVTVRATVVPEVHRSSDTSYARERLQLGLAVTASDGAFVIETDALDERISRWACAIQSCGEFQFQLSCLDINDTLLHETAPMSYVSEAPISIELREHSFKTNPEHWQDLSRRLLESQTARIDSVASELTTLSPGGIFRDWTVVQRLAMLGAMEQALLDPDNVLGNSGMPVRLRQLTSESGIETARERLRQIQRPDLLETLNDSIDRASQFVSLREIIAYVDPERIDRGDVTGGMNHYLQPDDRVAIDTIPWVASPLVGYRDYLRDRWVDHQRTEQQVGGPNFNVATRNSMFARLRNRLHQDFTVISTSDQPALRLLVGILRSIVQAPTGAGYGFAIAPAAIEVQGERTDREYLDYLVSLTKLSQSELEKRYRLNLQRSELDTTNPVQQNIDTLQRFFTDSYQSVLDPFAVAPNRKAGLAEPLIALFPLEGAGPFFLEYEEWLEREAAFFPENHFDPRSTYRLECSRKNSEDARTRAGEFNVAWRLPALAIWQQGQVQPWCSRLQPRRRQMAMGAQSYRAVRSHRSCSR